MSDSAATPSGSTDRQDRVNGAAGPRHERPSDRPLPPFRTFLCSDSEIRELLRDHRSIAMVGLDDDPENPSYQAALELKQRGYRVLPVHPDGKVVFGLPAAPSLAAIREKVEIVAVLPPTDAAMALAEQAASIGAFVFWLESGLADARAAYQAHKNGLAVVLDRSLLREYEMHFPDDELGYPG